MDDILKAIEKWGFKLNQMDVLEIFGGYGEFHIDRYAPLVKSMQIWETRPDRVEVLRNKYPQAEVKCVDSYEEIKETRDKFDIVIIDAASTDQHCSDLFPYIFRVLRDNTILIVDTRNFCTIVETHSNPPVGFIIKETFITENRKVPQPIYYIACWLARES